ncbi:MAG TPA: sigma-70 family RNA polymerase sigma factor [Candidatus Gracilibacteria bacterium]
MTPKALSKPEIENLVVKAQKGDELAFSVVYDYFFERIFKYVSFRVSGEYTEDLVADIFLKMVQNLHLYKPQATASFSAWIFRLAHNHIIDHYRKQKELLAGFDEDGEIDSLMNNLTDEHHLPPDLELQQMLQAEKIKDYLGELKPSYREILELKFYQDFSNREIAEVTGKSEGNIRIIQLRALKELREKLEAS